ncbi:MAG: AraC family transcriptional regulator [Cyanobacteria bacterium SZAS TMP-1]|nr:AraC family transcriptional regulator [Cyanobacteria bacterium SZAS TMP-1]
MDCLSDVLSTVHFTSTVYCQAEFSAPWGLQLDAYPGHTGFLMVVRGGCILYLDGQAPLAMGPGDLMMSPMGSGFTIMDAPGSPLVNLQEVVGDCGSHSKQLKMGGGGTQTTMIMGCFEFETSGKNPHPVLSALPPLLYVKAENLQSEPWLDTTFRFLAAEMAGERQGSSIVVSRLTDLLFVQTIRAHISQVKDCPRSTGWLKAIADPQIGRALTLIHENPAAPWTVSSLAEAVSMSRSSFASKFTALMNTSPLDYVTSWRMQKAQELLRQGMDNLAEIASRTGYQSEPAFRKAFKRETGVAPGSFRKMAIK